MHSAHPWISCALAFVTIVPAFAVVGSKRPRGFDIRADDSEKSRAAIASYRAGATRNSVAVQASIAAAQSRLNAAVPQLQVEVNPITKTPEIIGLGTAQGALTAPSKDQPEAVVRAFVASNATLFGLSVTQAAELKTLAAYTNPAGNLSWVELEQVINGIPVFQGTIRAAVRKDGAVARTTGNLAAGLDYARLPASPRLSAREALAAAARAIGVEIDPNGLPASTPENEGRTHTFPAGVFERETRLNTVYFALEPGLATLAYSMVLWEPVDAYYVLVDAASGELLWRKNITNDQTQAATYSIYGSDSPAPLSPSNATPGSGIQGTPVPRTSFTLVSELPAFDDLGWIPDGANTTSGNNVDAGVDIVSPNGIDTNGRAIGSPNRVFNFDYIPAGQPGEQPPTLANYRNGVVTNLFFWSNRYHDQLYQFGFTEAARNFQLNNFGRGGLGNDRVSAEAQDGSGTNNANFATPPDGQSGRMQMFLFDQPNPDRDGDLDQEIVIHELTHGTSNRLHANGSGLVTLQSGGMGEGWSDFYARALLSTEDEDLAGVYASGGYATFQFFTIGTDNYYYGIRRFPFALKSNLGANGRPHNPLTFADLDYGQATTADGAFAKSPLIGDDALEVHNAGEVWCMMLLEVRARIIQRLGFAAGNARMLQIVTDAMKLDPASPTFIQARDSIIAADNAGFQGEDVADIWAGFGSRGMGFGATITGTNSVRVVESSIAPNLVLGPVAFSDAVTGNNSGFADPGETIALTIRLINARTTTATGVAVSLPGGGSANYGDIGAGQTVSRAINYTVPGTTPSGTRLEIPVTLASSFGPVLPEPEKAAFNVGEPVVGFTENFDALPGPALPAGWTTSRTGSGALWTVTATVPDTPPRSAFTPNVTTTGTALLVTPNIPITSASAELTFRNAFNFEVFQGVSFDGMVLEISIGNTPFVDILAAGGRFLSGAYNAGVFALGGRGGWGGLSGGSASVPAYITTTVRLPASANGQDVRFRWLVACDDSVAAPGHAGAHVDGVSVANGTTFEVVTLAPVVTTSPGSAAYTENGAAVVVDPGLTIVDSDSATLVGATVSVTNNFSAGEDLLAFANQAGITGNYNGATGVLTLSGPAPVATYEAALRGVSYANPSDNPSPLVRTIAFVANDGVASNNPGSATRLVTVTAINDAPLLDAIANPVAIPEDAGAQTTNFSGLSAGGGEAQNLTVTATSDNPALVPNPTVLYTSPNATGLISYTPVADRFGSAMVTVTAQDNGGTANGGLDAVTRTFMVNVTAVNDPPTLSAISDPAAIPINSPQQTVNFSGISPGPNETEPLIVTATSDNLALIPNPAVTYTNPNGTGSLGYTPVANGSGSAVIRVTVDDGQAANNLVTRTFTVVVGAPNNFPTLAAIADPAPILEEAGAQTVSLNGIGDGDGAIHPVTITAASSNPALIPNPAVTYTSPNASGSLTYTPAANAFGTALITVTANDGQVVNNLTTRTFTVTVSAVNDAPALDPIGNQTPILEDAALQTVNLAGIGAGPSETQTVTVTATSDNPALIPNPSVNYTGGNTTGTLTYAPVANASGTATITVQAQDDGGTANGGLNTQTRMFTVSVTSVNDAPVFNTVADPAPILEDAGGQTINLSGVSAGPGESQTLTVTAASDNLALIPNPSVTYNSPGATALLNYTPLAQASGSATITVTLSDNGGTANGGGNIFVRTFTVNVTPVNDAPTLNSIPDPAPILEDAPAQTVSLAGLSAGLNEAQSLTVTASSSNPTLIPNPVVTYTSPNTTGSLTYTPAAGSSGTAMITVTARDNGGTANGGVEEITRNFTVNIAAVNDAPSFVKGPDQTLLEDAPGQTIGAWASAISSGAAGESTQAIDFIVANDNAPLFAIAPAIAPNGTLTFTPAPNANGTATITVRMHDNGGTANGGSDTSAPQTFTITVGAVNDVPAFTKGPDQTVLENAETQTISGWASGLSAGPANESAQLLEFVVSSNNSALFATAPAIAANGMLTYSPQRDANGVATITAQLRDNGGTANGGIDTSSARTFVITITAVNDAPAIDALPPLTINEGAPAQNVALTGISAGVFNEAQALTVTAVSSNAAIVPDPAVNYTSPDAAGTLTVAPLADANGDVLLTVSVRDDGGTANGGTDLTTRSFSITVNPINDAPAFVVGPNIAISSRSGPQTVSGASALSPGPADEAGQTLSFETTTDQPALFTTPPSVAPDGTLTFTPSPGAIGTATVTLTLLDSGGTANGGTDRSAPQSFTITLSSDNIAPSFVAGPRITLPLGATAFTQIGWAKNISPGPPDEIAQIVDFLVSNDNPTLFEVAPAVALDGTLTFTPAPGKTGRAQVTVRAHDNGGTAGSGVDTSAPQTVIIAIATSKEEFGRYYGLIVAVSEGPREHARFGMISTGFSRKGAFTAKLTIGGKRFAVKGRVSPIGEVAFGKSGTPNALLKRGDLPPLTLVLNLDTVDGTDQLTGTLTAEGAPFSTISADRALYSRKRRPLPPFINPPTNLLGRYTLVFPAQTAVDTGVPEALFPQGDGIGFLKVSRSGRARVVGRLADGSKVSGGSALSKANVLPFHALTDRKKGSITGPLTFRDQPLISDLDASNLVWFKPATTGQVYPAGWPGGITVDLVGARYRAPSGESALPGVGPPDADGNAAATLADRALAPPLRIPLNLSAENKVAVVTPGPEDFELKIEPRTGALSGSFVHPQTGSKTKVVGVILQKQALGSGFFLSTGESGAFGLAPETIPAP